MCVWGPRTSSMDRTYKHWAIYAQLGSDSDAETLSSLTRMSDLDKSSKLGKEIIGGKNLYKLRNQLFKFLKAVYRKFCEISDGNESIQKCGDFKVLTSLIKTKINDFRQWIFNINTYRAFLPNIVLGL